MTDGPRRIGGFGRLVRLTLKEEREILRDKRTLVTLVVMPLLLYPLLGLAVQQFLVAGAKKQAPPTLRIGLESKQDAIDLESLFKAYDDWRRNAPQAARSWRDRSAGPEPSFAYQVLPREALDLMLKDAGIDVIVQFARRRASAPDFSQPIAIDLKATVIEGRQYGRQALEELERRARFMSRELLRGRLQFFKAEQRPEPLRMDVERLPSPDPPETVPLAVVVPLILIMMTVTGAVYPAIDLTAGERERGTLEVLMAAPVPRMSLLFAKYVAVVTVALLTALVNLIAMSLTLWLGDLGPMLFSAGQIGPKSIAQALAALVLFAAFFSAVLLALCSFARSFKEAQSYLIPLMLASLAPGIVSLLPNVELDAATATVPLLNMVLLARDLFRNQAEPALVTLALLSTITYAMLALAMAARLFGSEGVLYNSPWIGAWRRSPKWKDSAGPAGALLAIALAVPALLFLKGAVRKIVGPDLVPALSGNGLVLFVVFVGIPLFACWAGRIRRAKAFGLARPPVFGLMGATALGGSLWYFALAAARSLQNMDWIRNSPEIADKIAALARELTALPLPQRLLLLAAAPAIAEEIFFRGFVLRGLLVKGKATAILVSGIVFGLFHALAIEGITLERVPSSTALGIVLGWLAVRTGSILPGMLLHFLHNAIGATALGIPEKFAKWTEWNATNAGAFGLIAATGFALVWLGGVRVSAMTSEEASPRV
jgi:ABC-2 type transport system permease protein/sodium transport system permease protein